MCTMAPAQIVFDNTLGWGPTIDRATRGGEAYFMVASLGSRTVRPSALAVSSAVLGAASSWPGEPSDGTKDSGMLANRRLAPSGLVQAAPSPVDLTDVANVK